ncbi:RBR-type E3 ubiquitin transferase [Aphelenchoides bicaudatus]|nr:RBR-type E3 ubiquitin transferase [Aphelenchoides bicaudatus]
MSIKGNRATKNLSTLVECSENGEDTSSLVLAGDEADKQTSGRCSAYETASSKFSTNGVDETIVECATVGTPSPSESINPSSKHMRNLSDTTSKSRSESSPKNAKRKRSSGLSAASFADLSPEYHAASSSNAYQAANPGVQKSFSFRAFLNNMTAPVRRSKQEKHGKDNTSTGNSKDTLLSKSERKQQKNAEKGIILLDTKIKVINVMADEDVERARHSSDGQIPANINHFRRNYMESVLSYIQDETSDGHEGNEYMECQVCFSLRPLSQFPSLINCSHRPCRICLEVYLKIEIMENRIIVNCPECPSPMHPNDIYTILCMNHQLLLSYEKFLVRRVLLTEPDVRFCPGPDCDYAVIANSCAACPKLECERPECRTLFCYHCKGEWHANQTCDEARGKSMERMFASAASALNRSGSLNELIGAASSSTNEPFKPSDLKACPRCHTLIVKMNDGSCNHMVCPMCQADFCWLCLKEISDLHYLSPTGCTFWGKKPWTRKKKLLWQVGTLIGAPVGIALIAGLAVPGIICGVPVFVGRKIYQRFSGSSKARRRLLTAAGVSGSLVVSPVLAVLAVGVGVPIMLAYVYGVVPLSLCRNGGCGGGSAENTLENFVEDEEELGNIATGLRVYDNEENDRLLRKHLSEIEKLDRSSMATRISTNSGFSLNAASTSAAGGSSRTHGAHGHATQADVLSSSSAKINLMVDQRKRKMSVESYATVLGEKSNFESASTKAQAGSHYHFDNKSVHTVCSGNSEAPSYCCGENEESSSIKPMSGSIDGKSMGDSASLRFARQCRANSRPERDLSPSSIYSLNDQTTRLPQRSNGQCPNPSLSNSGNILATAMAQVEAEAVEVGENVGGVDNRDPFRVRTLMDNLRQILNDDDDEQTPNASRTQKKRPPAALKQNQHKQTASVGASRVAAKIQFDTHQRAFSVQIPTDSNALRRSMPSLNTEPMQTSLTPQGTVVITEGETKNGPQEVKNRRRRFANLFRPFRSDKSSDN